MSSVTTPCLPWQRSKNKKGYGHLWINGKTVAAHRAAWEAAKGLIPTGANVLHECDNPACVNTDHLFLGTLRDNTQDMIRKGRGRGSSDTNRQKTHCLNGHPLSGPTVRLNRSRVERVCVTCETARKAAWTSTHREQERARLRAYRDAKREERLG